MSFQTVVNERSRVLEYCLTTEYLHFIYFKTRIRATDSQSRNFQSCFFRNVTRVRSLRNDFSIIRR